MPAPLPNGCYTFLLMAPRPILNGLLFAITATVIITLPLLLARPELVTCAHARTYLT